VIEERRHCERCYDVGGGGCDDITSKGGGSVGEEIIGKGVSGLDEKGDVS